MCNFFNSFNAIAVSEGTMVLIKWKSEYETGVSLIDNLHRKIHNIIIELEGSKEGCYRSTLFSDFVGCCRHHLLIEEIILRNNPQLLDRHKKRMAGFDEAMGSLQKQVIQGENTGAGDWVPHIGKWFSAHLEEDRSYVFTQETIKLDEASK